MARWRDERGDISVMMIFVGIVVIAGGGLVFDGGRLLTARRDAINRAEAAARAGVVTVSPIRGLDPDQARQDAYDYLAAVGIPATDADVTVDDQTVVVTVRERRTSVFAIVGGIKTETVSGTGRATAQGGDG
jgi:Flp pilus assembly protein TadG